MSKVRNPIKQQFFNYLTGKCNLTANTANTYIASLNSVDNFMKTVGITTGSLYDMRDLYSIEAAKDETLCIDEFILIDKIYHGNLDCSLRHYYNFAAQNHMFNHSWK